MESFDIAFEALIHPEYFKNRLCNYDTILNQLCRQLTNHTLPIEISNNMYHYLKYINKLYYRNLCDFNHDLKCDILYLKIKERATLRFIRHDLYKNYKYRKLNKIVYTNSLK